MAAVCAPPSPRSALSSPNSEAAFHFVSQPHCDIKQNDSSEIIYRSQQHHLAPFTHKNLAAFILESASLRYSSKTALVDGTSGIHYTYSQVEKWVTKTAAGLGSLGVRPRDVVLLLSPNLPEFPIVYLAVVSLGAVVAPANPLNTETDIVKQAKQSDAKFVITVPELMSKVQSCNLPTVLIGDDANCSKFKSTSITLLSELCEAKKFTNNSIEYHETNPDDTCTLLFSSGTTGMSKAVELTHRNFMSAITAYNTLEPGASTSEMDVCLAIIPMYHVYGLGIVMLATLERGACVVTMERYSLSGMLQYIEKYRITVATLVPPIIVSMVKSMEIMGKYDLSTLRIIATGAAPLKEDTMRACQAMLPHCILRQGYGMTEAPLVAFSVVANERRQWGSVGVLVPGTEARITDVDTGKSLPPMASGELWIRGPQVMRGYLNNPEVTAASKDDRGWLHTGDLAFMDTNGYFFIVDRLKEIIKYKAHQVAPGELEAVLLTHPGIVDAAVIPLPDEDAGEIPLAYVVKREGSELTESDIMIFVGKQVAPYKKVRKVEFINAIPKSAAGKILRKDLTARHRCSQ